MEKKPKLVKPVKTLRLRKEALKTLTTDQLTQVAGGIEGCCAYGGTAINSASA